MLLLVVPVILIPVVAEVLWMGFELEVLAGV